MRISKEMSQMILSMKQNCIFKMQCGCGLFILSRLIITGVIVDAPIAERQRVWLISGLRVGSDPSNATFLVCFWAVSDVGDLRARTWLPARARSSFPPRARRWWSRRSGAWPAPRGWSRSAGRCRAAPMAAEWETASTDSSSSSDMMSAGRREW